MGEKEKEKEGGERGKGDGGITADFCMWRDIWQMSDIHYDVDGVTKHAPVYRKADAFREQCH